MECLDDFSLRVEQNGRGSVVRIVGELDIATAPRLRQCLADLDGANVTLDFSDVTFMDSSGIAVLDWATKRARRGGADLLLRGVRPAQMKVLEITRMTAKLSFDGDGG